MKITFFFSNNLSFTYQLNETETASKWLGMMEKITLNNMSRQEENHRHGFASKDKIRSNIRRLTDICQRIGMPRVDLANNNWLDWQKSLNDIHAAFPPKVVSGIHFKEAHTCNLLIHWLEYELSNLFDDAEQYLFNLDFNHQPKIYNLIQPIPTNEFNHFTTDIQFGVLNLHYVYIGRHFFEMFNANDLVCPQEQFKPQWFFNATCAVNFSEAQPQDVLESSMRDYYSRRGGLGFFHLKFDDPRLAKGFFKLGELQDLSQYSLSDRVDIRMALKYTSVTGWRIDK